LNKPTNGSRATMQLGPFVEDVYLPYIDRQKHKSTSVGYCEKWRNYLKPLCSDLWIRDVRTCDMQKVLDIIAARHPNLGRATLQRCKTLLSGIFSFAARQGYFDGPNPVIGTEIPTSAHGKGETVAYSLAEIKGMLAVLPNPANAIVAIAAFAGLSKSEIEGLTWESYDTKEIAVTRGRVHGIFGEPKTPQRRASVPVIPWLRRIVDNYRKSIGDPKTGPMFADGMKRPNGEKHPVSLNNLCNRVIRPIMGRCGVCLKAAEEHDAKTTHAYQRDESLPVFCGYHGFRRGLATNLHDLGVDDMTIQRIMRHSNVSVTQQCYFKTMPSQVTKAMEQFSQKVESSLCSNRAVSESSRPN
jgi:integrase